MTDTKSRGSFGLRTGRTANGTHVFHSESVAKGYCEDNDISNVPVHVIEHSAYLAVVKERDELRDRLTEARKLLNGFNLPAVKRCEVERDRYRAALENIVLMAKTHGCTRCMHTSGTYHIQDIVREALNPKEGNIE